MSDAQQLMPMAINWEDQKIRHLWKRYELMQVEVDNKIINGLRARDYEVPMHFDDFKEMLEWARYGLAEKIKKEADYE